MTYPETILPSAFPRTADTAVGPHAGMTLRDYFAAAALIRWTDTMLTDPASPGRIAAAAYAIADAMLEARER